MGTPRDQNGFEHLFLCHQQSLIRRAAQLTRARSEAEDLYQDTIERAWRTYDRIRHSENPRGWLLRIMFNLFVDDRRRRQKLRELPATALGEASAPEPYEAVPWEMVTEKDLRLAMNRLPRAHREILQLNVVERRSYKEIAATLRIPVATVGSRLHRARRQVREVLEGPIVPHRPFGSSHSHLESHMFPKGPRTSGISSRKRRLKEALPELAGSLQA